MLGGERNARSSKWGQRFKLVAFVVLGTIFAFLHHCLGSYLSGKPIPRDVSISGVHIHRQSYVNALSNALSQIVKFFFVSTIGVTFAQCFFLWKEAHDVSKANELDAPLAAAQGNPFSFSALPTWLRAPGLAFSSLTMMTMIAIPIFVPASIIPVSGPLIQPCNISSPNISMAYLAQTYIYTDDPKQNQYIHNPTIPTTAVVNNVITGGSYLPVPSPCGVCSYQVSFTGAALDCSSDVNGTYDFATNLPFSDGTYWYPLFNGTLTREDEYVLTVATRDGVVKHDLSVVPHMNPPVAVSCHAFRAHYDVLVQHDNFSSHIDILNITPGPRLSAILGSDPDPSDVQLNGLIVAIGQAFTGPIVLHLLWDDLNEGSTLIVGYSPLLHWSPDIPNDTSTFKWSNLTTSLPSLTQNVSLSLLSGQFSPLDTTYMTQLQTECRVTQLIYSYNPKHLVAIYGAALTTAMIFLSLGLYTVQKNGEEHSLDFSHVLGALGYSRIADSGAIQESTAQKESATSTGVPACFDKEDGRRDIASQGKPMKKLNVGGVTTRAASGKRKQPEGNNDAAKLTNVDQANKQRGLTCVKHRCGLCRECGRKKVMRREQTKVKKSETLPCSSLNYLLILALESGPIILEINTDVHNLKATKLMAERLRHYNTTPSYQLRVQVQNDFLKYKAELKVQIKHLEERLEEHIGAYEKYLTTVRALNKKLEKDSKTFRALNGVLERKVTGLERDVRQLQEKVNRLEPTVAYIHRRIVLNDAYNKLNSSYGLGSDDILQPCSSSDSSYQKTAYYEAHRCPDTSFETIETASTSTKYTYNAPLFSAPRTAVETQSSPRLAREYVASLEMAERTTQEMDPS
ncbi:hypothetical protein F5887DRAFT_922827 [Amanita rubescens]|nr:hypothetical protein F5887DRAFT_922827 [Amanita rubescens]